MARVGPQRHKKKKVICNMSMVKSRKEIMTHLELNVSNLSKRLSDHLLKKAVAFQTS